MTAPDPADSYRLGRRQRVRVVTCRRRQRGTGPGCARARALGHVHRRVESWCITSSPTPTRSGCSGDPRSGWRCLSGRRAGPSGSSAGLHLDLPIPAAMARPPPATRRTSGWVRGCGPYGDGSESPTGQTMSTSAVPHRRPRSTYSPHRFLQHRGPHCTCCAGRETTVGRAAAAAAAGPALGHPSGRGPAITFRRAGRSAGLAKYVMWSHPTPGAGAREAGSQKALCGETARSMT